MLKKTKSATIALIITVSLIMIMGQNSGYASTNAPAALKIYVGPTSVPADNNSYTCIYVQLLDSSQHPTRALQDTVIGLSSSNTNIGTVKPSITIPASATYASTSFQTTFSPGSSTIAATASGFATVQAAVTTIGPIPAKVAVYGYPSSLPADGNTYNCILVQLQDSSGAPAKAPKQGVQVTLSCSDTTDVGSVASNVTITGRRNLRNRQLHHSEWYEQDLERFDKRCRPRIHVRTINHNNHASRHEPERTQNL